MTIHIYTGREEAPCLLLWSRPWQIPNALRQRRWLRVLQRRECPTCSSPVYLNMEELGHSYWCVQCSTVWVMPVLGLGPEDIFRFGLTLRMVQARAYNRAWAARDDYGRDITSGKFTRDPSIRSYTHYGWDRAIREAALATPTGGRK